MLDTLKPIVRRLLAGMPGGASLERPLRRLYRTLAHPAPASLPAVPVDSALRPPAIGIVSPSDDPGLGVRLAAAAPGLLVVLPAIGGAATAGCAYVYAPRSARAALSATHLQNVLLGLAQLPADFALVTRSLEEAPALALAGELRDQAVFAAEAAAVFLDGAAPARPLTGRLLRLLPAPDGVPVAVTTLDAVLGHAAPQAADAWIGLGGPPSVPAPRAGAGQPLPLPRPEGDKPLVLVLPIFLAVGGVERNTIEIMKALKDRWNFLVVTSERLAARQGSLHHQTAGVAPIFDLAELSENPHHLALLASLARGVKPDVVWICNGSPWLVQHAAALRDLFDGVPIIDQQVYDTEVGWIEHYPDPGIQSFDRFIAINRRIRDTFTGRLGMDPARIDLIYSAIDARRFDKPEPDEAERARLSALTGIPTDRRAFAFIGRLTDQKEPLNFLDLARRARAEGSPDRYVLIGDGELAGACEAFIAEHGLDNVQRIPFCNDLTQVYPLLSGMIVSSKFEGLPIAMLEALAMGVPVLATDTGDIRVVLEEYGSGLVVVPCDVAALADGWTRWLADLPAYRERARTAAPAVRTRFSTTTIAGQYEECWRRAMADRGTSR
ncbi:glycosyltransferase family 4 protein [Azospirillum sp.]|uniref:glycosyltransferase family 4 protein n=1 Tax=Azospirillum sp. TaxID=34012 RepID=UPI002D69A0FF|nr:glycosyltransferase family 4 protein [Azospirillum sp.]HYD69462.1 glycosyltransferase family 4 protein [Azospirillum sp.]